MKPIFSIVALALLVSSVPAEADERSRLRVDFDDVQADLEGFRWHLLSSDVDLAKSRRSGEVIYGLADGEHQIRILSPGNPTATCQLGSNDDNETPDDGGAVFVRPAATHQFVQRFANCAAGRVAAASATSIVVSLGPSAAIAGGAKWALDPAPNQPISWLDSGVSVPVSQGDHLVVFKPVTSGPCQETPANQAVAVYFGESRVRADYRGQNC